MRILLLLIVGGLLELLSARPAGAQVPVFSRQPHVPVQHGSRLLTSPLAGGLQSPQFSAADLNGDGLDDLFVFDRTDGTVLTFLNTGATMAFPYVHAPQYEQGFPPLRHWALLRDYDGDGRPDLLTAHVAGGFLGASLYRNVSEGDSLAFQLVRAGLRTADQSPILIPVTDLPAWVDVDGDGDLDLLSFDFGGQFVVYYRNRQVEDQLTPDSLRWERASGCWGGFEEDLFNSTLYLNVPCDGQRPSATKAMHAGSTLLVTDLNGDQLPDIVLGDIAHDNLQALYNGGTADTARMVIHEGPFPATDPVSLHVFPAAYAWDTNNDGQAELVVAPNDGSEFGSANHAQVLRYARQPNGQWSQQQNDFLVGEMIDVGAVAAPVFVDVDGDGDLDLILGTYAFRQSPTTQEARLTLYTNVGTPQAPAFVLADTNFANLRAQQRLGLMPTFGDLDGDGDPDLLVGEQTGKLLHYENTASVGQPATFTLVTDFFAGIDAGTASAPCLADLDGDGDLDLWVGDRSGAIRFYRNHGTPAQPVFDATPEVAAFGEIDTRQAPLPVGFAVPYVADLNGDGHPDLLVGTYGGDVLFCDNIANGATAALVTHRQLYVPSADAAPEGFRLGRRLQPTAADLDGDGVPELWVGTYRGGLAWFGQPTAPAALPRPTARPLALVAMPNPVSRLKGELRVRLPTTKPGQWQAIDAWGRTYEMKGWLRSAHEWHLNVRSLPSGLYIFTWQTEMGVALRTGLIRVE